jgi:excisionase family DNA binding protein
MRELRTGRDARFVAGGRSMSSHDALAVALPAVLTVDELAAYLRLNRKSVYAAIREGAIPGARRIGGTIRIDRDTVLTWLSGEGRVSTSRRNP